MINLTLKQAQEIVDMFGGEEGEVDSPILVTIQHCKKGHNGEGLYAHWEACPEEGAIYLGVEEN